MFSLKNKVTVVTGAGSGIGAAIAQKFAEAGARVFVAERDEASGNEIVASIRKAGGAAEFVMVDVANEVSCKNAGAKILVPMGGAMCWLTMPASATWNGAYDERR